MRLVPTLKERGLTMQAPDQVQLSQQGQIKSQCPEFLLHFKLLSLGACKRLLGSHPCSLPCSQLPFIPGFLLELVYGTMWPWAMQLLGPQSYKNAPVPLPGEGERETERETPLHTYTLPLHRRPRAMLLLRPRGPHRRQVSAPSQCRSPAGPPGAAEPRKREYLCFLGFYELGHGMDQVLS